MDPLTGPIRLEYFVIPIANLAMLVAIYLQLARQNGRIGKVETAMGMHIIQDDKRHEEDREEHGRFWRRIDALTPPAWRRHPDHDGG